MKPPHHCIGIVSFYALPDFICTWCALVGKPTLLLVNVHIQLEAVRQDIRSVKDKVGDMMQDLVIAKQAGNKEKEKVKFLCGRLEKLVSQLLRLHEEKNILLRGQASGNHCFQLDMLAYFRFHHVALLAVNGSPQIVNVAYTLQAVNGSLQIVYVAHTRN